MSITKEMHAMLNANNIMQSQKDPMLASIKLHEAWKEKLSLIECESLLQNHSPFTYVLRQGDSPYQFFISYVEIGLKIKHVPFKLELTTRKWSYRNGTGIINDNLNEFIPMVMHCLASQCKPLKFEVIE